MLLPDVALQRPSLSAPPADAPSARRRRLASYLLALDTAALLAGTSARAQAPRPGGVPSSDRAAAHVATIFDAQHPKPQVLLLGVFHFAGEQVDANTTPLDLRVDMLSADRQAQIDRLVHALAMFRPTKIAIEAPPHTQARVDSLYRAYQTETLRPGPHQPLANETYQLGFRLAALLKLDRLYAVDAQPFRFVLSARDSAVTFEKYRDQPLADAEYWDRKYDAWSAYNDTLKYAWPLARYLAYLNSEPVAARSIGRWLVATKRGTNDEPIGADGFITRYTNRNIRIFSNIQRIVTSPSDRVLVIYGATHMYLLRQLFAASPEFALQDIQPYLR